MMGIFHSFLRFLFDQKMNCLYVKTISKLIDNDFFAKMLLCLDEVEKFAFEQRKKEEFANTS